MDGSNWEPSVELLVFTQGGVAPGLVLQTEDTNFTSLTKNTVLTTTVNAANVNANTIITDTINSSNGILDTILINDATVSTMSVSELNAGDFYTYSYVNSFAANNTGFIVALGTASSKETSIQWSVNGSNWYDIISGGFSPCEVHTPSNVIHMTQPKGLLYNPDIDSFIAYSITNDYLVDGDISSVIQFSPDVSQWKKYNSDNILDVFGTQIYSGISYITDVVLNSINSVAYLPSNAGNPGRYFLLTSNIDSVWTSAEPGNFYETSTLSALSTLSGGAGGYGWNGPALVAAHGSLKVGSDFYITGTASPGGCPIYKCSTGDGLTFNPLTTQALPPTVYSMTADSNTNKLFIAGPGITVNTSTISTVMYSTNNGTTWQDMKVQNIGYQNLLEATSIYYGCDSNIAASNKLVVTGKARTAVSTILFYAYSNDFQPNMWTASTSNGFTSVIDRTGVNITPTYIGTATFFNPNTLDFLVGGLTNNPLTCIKQNTMGGNAWDNAGSLNFNGVAERQFADSTNRSMIPNTLIAQKLTTTNLYSQMTSSVLLQVSTANIGYANIPKLIAANTLSVNISSSTVHSSNMNVNNLVASNITVGNVVISKTPVLNTNGIFTLYGTVAGSNGLNIDANSITTNTLNVITEIYMNTPNSRIYAEIIDALRFRGDGSEIGNVKAASLTSNQSYDIGSGTIKAAVFQGDGSQLTGINPTGNSINPSNITATGNASIGGTRNVTGSITTSGGFYGNGTNITNVTACNLVTGNSYNIGTGNFTANRFYGDGSQLTGVSATGGSVGFATNATNASNIVVGGSVNTNTYVRVGHVYIQSNPFPTPVMGLTSNIGFHIDTYNVNGSYTTNTPLNIRGNILYGNDLILTGNVYVNRTGNSGLGNLTATMINSVNISSSNQVSAGGGFVGDGSKLTGTALGFTAGSALACSGNSATATTATTATNALACSGNSATATYATTAGSATTANGLNNLNSYTVDSITINGATKETFIQFKTFNTSAYSLTATDAIPVNNASNGFNIKQLFAGDLILRSYWGVCVDIRDGQNDSAADAGNAKKGYSYSPPLCLQ